MCGRVHINLLLMLKPIYRRYRKSLVIAYSRKTYSLHFTFLTENSLTSLKIGFQFVARFQFRLFGLKFNLYISRSLDKKLQCREHPTASFTESDYDTTLLFRNPTFIERASRGVTLKS